MTASFPTALMISQAPLWMLADSQPSTFEFEYSSYTSMYQLQSGSFGESVRPHQESLLAAPVFPEFSHNTTKGRHPGPLNVTR